MNYLIEIATTDFTSTKLAVEGGADRIELCAALSEGGITQSPATIRKCREQFQVQLFPIIRPRAGDFLYDNDEFKIMLNDIKYCKSLGCDGVVIGILEKDGGIDVLRTAKLVQLAYPLEVTFHRAFDRCRDAFEALEQLIQIGCQRILTSGQKRTASEGIELIEELVRVSDGRIIIVPGSGVRMDNIKEIAERTKAIEFHTSLRSQRPTSMSFVHPAFADDAETMFNPAINPEEVKALRNALH